MNAQIPSFSMFGILKDQQNQMNRLKRVTMSHLPLRQSPLSICELYDNVKADMLVFGEEVLNNDFTSALFALRDEQALVFSNDQKEPSVIATQFGFRVYGTN